MTVRTIDTSQVHPLQEHLDAAVGLAPDQISDIRTLVAQLEGIRVLPIIGAGASHDCGMRLARAIGEDLHNDYINDPKYAPHDVVSKDLSDVAQAIYNAEDQVAVVHAVGLPDPALWPTASDITEHFCAYRVLARLAREGLFDEAIGFNYDCAKEAALLGEGFLLSVGTSVGRLWPDHATIVADRASFYEPQHVGALTYMKAHGCAARFRELAVTDEASAAETIIICKSQLTNWRNDTWMQERLRDRIRTNVLLLIGFAGQDATIHGELQIILNEVYAELPRVGAPRVVVIDWQPNTATLRGLIKSGLGGISPPDGVVTSISVSTASTTAVMLILLAELLRLRIGQQLTDQGYVLPHGLDPQLAALTITAPLMLRWTYLLRPPADNGFIQRINLEQAAQRGYVPLMTDPQATARVLRTRVELRQRLGIVGDESTRGALGNHGFIVHGGFAYLPVALDRRQLRAACRLGGPVGQARTILGHPTHLECVVVAGSRRGLVGVNIETGAEVTVPA